jgi:Ulp1 family protease
LKEDIETLKPKGWLNDKIIDFWFKRLTRFEESDGESAVYAFLSCFYDTLGEQRRS